MSPRSSAGGGVGMGRDWWFGVEDGVVRLLGGWFVGGSWVG